MGQLDHGLCLSPQRLRRDKASEIKHVFPRKPGVHGAAELVREYGERFGFAMFVFEFREIRFARLALPDEENRRFGKRPAEMDMANFLARGSSPFALGFFGALHQATVGDKILPAGKALDVVDLL